LLYSIDKFTNGMIINMRPLRILVVAQTPPPFGGQAVMTEYLLKGKYTNIELIHVRMNFSKELKFTGRFHISKTWELIRVIVAIYWMKLRKNPVILYYPPAGPTILAIIRDICILGATRWLFRATVFHFHTGGICQFADSMNPLLRKLFYLVFDKPDLAIYPSYGTPSVKTSLHCKREFVIPNGMPDVSGASINRGVNCNKTVNILFVSMLYERKGLFVAIQAVNELLMAGMNVELTCLGEWHSREVKKQAEIMIKPEYKSRFRFPGVQSGNAKWEYYRKADIFLFPSFAPGETFGVVLIEAMCFGLPVVASRWGGIPEVVDENSCAIICNPRDVAGCRDALARLVNDSGLRQRMGKAGRERYLSHFTIDIYRKAMENALFQLDK